ncbi:MAG: PAS domain S-box protein [Acidobacteriota bacterium]|nr:PAS domain S-box protein [Acidobacteriota bacterium]
MVDRESQFKEVLECFPIPAYLFDGQALRFIMANSRYCELVGYTERELIELPWPKILADDEVAFAEKAVQAAGPDRPVVWTWRRKDGQTVTAAVRYAAIKFVKSDNTLTDAYLATVMSTGREIATMASQVYGN